MCGRGVPKDNARVNKGGSIILCGSAQRSARTCSLPFEICQCDRWETERTMHTMQS